MTRKEKITIRLDNHQLQCLKELKDKLKCSYSLMIRSIIGDFLKKNERSIDRIIDDNTDSYDD